jgi:hypothetical protein
MLLVCSCCLCFCFCFCFCFCRNSRLSLVREFFHRRSQTVGRTEHPSTIHLSPLLSSISDNNLPDLSSQGRTNTPAELTHPVIGGPFLQRWLSCLANISISTPRLNDYNYFFLGRPPKTPSIYSSRLAPFLADSYRTLPIDRILTLVGTAAAPQTPPHTHPLSYLNDISTLSAWVAACT